MLKLGKVGFQSFCKGIALLTDVVGAGVMGMVVE